MTAIPGVPSPALNPVEGDAAILDQHLEEFITQGYTIVPAAHDLIWVEAARSRFTAMRERAVTNTRDQPTMFANLLELEPDLGLQAITRPRILDLAERIIGPHVQLESMTFAGIPPLPRPLPTDLAAHPGWHRDLFASFPRSDQYQRPLLFNAITYLQDLTDEIGPLHVIPGSHRRPCRIAPEQKHRPHPEAQVVYPKAGDSVLFHHALLHAGSHNRSQSLRFFYCVTYNHSWLKFRDNYSGPACQTIINTARARGDRRLLRLLGADQTMIQRALHHHVLEPEEPIWTQWQAEDRAALGGA